LEPIYEDAARNIDLRLGMSEQELMNQIEDAARGIQPYIDQKAEEIMLELQSDSYSQ
jgi:hypothetical protein